METVSDFEDMLFLLEKHGVRYLIIGGLAFIYHAKPRYTKDMDIWVDAKAENIKRANMALTEFGSPALIVLENKDEILQIDIAPDRIDFLCRVAGARFETAWKKRIRGKYGGVTANWVDIDSLIRIKSRIEHPRHQEDARVLRDVRKRRAGNAKKRI